LDATFQKQRIEKDGPTLWPPRSPDITLWTVLWGYVKDRMYSTPIPDISTLKARIRDALTAVTEGMFEKSSID
jgi:hypothetical protein